MKHMRHWLMMVTLLCGLAANAHDFEVDGIFYNITSSSDLTVEVVHRGSSYSEYSNEYSGAVIIPSAVTYDSKTYTVTGIGNHAFDGCTGLTSISIPQSVGSIGYRAFQGCSNMKTLVLEDGGGVLKLSYYSTSYYDSPFDSCPLDSLYLGRNLKYGISSTSARPFRDKTKLRSVVIGDSVTSVDSYAFYGCSSLGNVSKGNKVTSIGEYSFYNCKALTSLSFIAGITSIPSYAFAGCIGLTDVRVPSSVTSIGYHAFDGCTGLTSVSIPQSVGSIDYRAFKGCSNMKSLVLEDGGGVLNLSYYNSYYDSPFDSCPLDSLYLGRNLKYGISSTSARPFRDKTKLCSVVISDSVTSVDSYAFYNCGMLNQVTIGLNVASIGENAFSNCGALSVIECDAPDCPKLNNSFSNYSALLYVPTAFMEQYQQADGWKNFNILPLLSNRLNVSFPVEHYNGMYLELTDSHNKLLSRVLISQGASIALYLPDEDDNTFNVYLKNKYGKVLGVIENIMPTGENMTVLFDVLLQPKSIAINVCTPDGTDVTENSIVTWYDENANYLCRDTILSGQVENTEVKYSVKLSKELAMQYKQPEQTTYMVKPSGNEIKEILEPFASVEVTGMVRDSVTGTPISDAMVTFSQKLNGEYAHITRAETDSKGAFKATLYDVPAEVTVAAADYISYTMSLDTLTKATALGDILMKSISGVVVSVGFTYRTSVPDGDTPEILGWYTDYDNVKYGILNKTTGLPVSNFSVQYPQLVLLDGVSAGDELLLTVVSRTGSFEPTQTTVVVDSALQCDATFDIVELGGIEASYTSTTNSAVVGILYNEIGEMVQKRSYSSGSLTLDNLRDGSYTLVTMGSSDYFNAIYNLSQLSAVGLVEGTDYVKHAVKVESGVVSVVEMESVPAFDESKLYYTGGDTRFTVNKTSATAGNYLTLTGKIDFKEEYASKVSDVSMVIDLPESAVFVDNSVMVGAAVAAYTLEGNRLIISLSNNYTERVRFCIIPTESGSYAPTAFARFTIDGKEVLQPIGSAHYTIKDLSIEVLSISAKTTIPVSGTAIGQSTIQIYDNDVLIGETTSLANGVWNTTCELHEPYNLSKHRIHAKVITSMGLELTSEAKECMYDMNAVQVSKVTMYHFNPETNGWKGHTYTSVFDFMNPSSKPNKWTVYYPEKKFTYTVEFTNNSPEVVQNVILYIHTADGKVVPLYPEYNEEKDLWTADIDMGNRRDGYYPVNVSVDFECESDVVISRDAIMNLTYDFNEMNDGIDEMSLKVDSLLNIIGTLELGTQGEDLEMVWEQLYETLRVDTTLLNIPSTDVTGGALLQFAEDLMAEIDTYDSINSKLIWHEIANLQQTFEYDLSDLGIEGKVSRLSCDGISIDSLENNSDFVKYKLDDGTCIYFKMQEEIIEYVDISTDTYIIVHLLSYSSLASGTRAVESEFSKLWNNISILRNSISFLADGCDDITNQLNRYIADLSYQLASSRNTSEALCDAALNTPFDDQKVSWMKASISMDKRSERIAKQLALAENSRLVIAKIASKALSLYSLVDNAVTLYNDLRNLANLADDVPGCLNYPERSKELIDRINRLVGGKLVSATVNIGMDIAAINAAWTSVAAAPATGGASLSVTLATFTATLIKAGVNMAIDYTFRREECSIRNAISSLAKDPTCTQCGGPNTPPCPDPNPNNPDDPDDPDDPNPDDPNPDDPNPDDPSPDNPDDPSPDDPKKPAHPNPNNNGGEHQSGQPGDDVQIDPSGYVYEGVSSNRLEGVMASCYYKETVEDIYGDQHENIVLWDAEEYAQENPLFTDANGMYRWDVPKGLWQVKFEKEGYETTYSEWLPVPPPQLEVNIPMVQNKQPEVAGVHAYKDGVEIEFDKYMQPATLNTDNIFMIQNGEKVAGTVTLLNEEVAYEGKSETYASKVRFVFDQPITAKEITLTVVNSVKSYAGLQMQDAYIQTLAIEQEVEGIVADSLVSMYYGGEQTLTVKVIPAAAAAGKTLVVTSSSPTILGVDTDSIVLDDSGEAVLTVSGELPGMGAISYSLVGYDYRASTLVEVVYDNTKMTANPTASIASGTTVKKGTEVTLSCSTEGAAIYYTLDGSCPCDDTAILYDGTPIVINENTELRIMAVAEGMYESDVVVYNYYVEGADVEEVTLPFGIDPTIATDGFRVQGIEAECTVAVYGVDGVLVMQREHVKNNTFINIAHVPEGMYIVVVSKDDDTHKQRILKVK